MNLLHATPVETLRERVFQVFGSELLEDLIDLGERTSVLQRQEEDELPRQFTVRGFVSRPQVQKNNRNSIYVFVNGRLIRDRLILHALSSAYHNLMPASSFPFALIFLDCDNEEVDVNVHPSKTEVRFRHQSWVHDFVRDAVRDQLMLSRPAPSFTPGAQIPIQRGAALPYSDFSQVMHNETGGASLPATVPEFTLHTPAPPAARFDFGDVGIAVVNEPRQPEQTTTTLKLRIPDTHGGFPFDANPVSSMANIGELRPLGQLHNSFIIAAGRDGLWIIDQHVAHERILFEQVLEQQASGHMEVQQLLMPVIVQLTPEQQIEYARIADEMHQSGFETEPFGNRTIAVKAAPAAIGPADLERAIFEILEIAENELRTASIADVRRGIAASIACRAAIKINTPLDHRKMEWMLRTLAATDYPMACPHGRPVALQYSTRDILKSFHRI
jgi:DNA mismatch repair protein MutL